MVLFHTYVKFLCDVIGSLVYLLCVLSSVVLSVVCVCVCVFMGLGA